MAKKKKAKSNQKTKAAAVKKPSKPSAKSKPKKAKVSSTKKAKTDRSVKTALVKKSSEPVVGNGAIVAGEGFDNVPIAAGSGEILTVDELNGEDDDLSDTSHTDAIEDDEDDDPEPATIDLEDDIA